jgi:hypothetical protein
MHLGAGDLDQANPAEVAVVLEQLHGLAMSLRPRAALTLDKVCFCQEIENFGIFIPRPTDYQFQAGSDGRPGERVQVYAEVRNFTSRQRGAYYETALASTLEILDYRKDVVVTMKLPASVDRSLSQRQDYYINFQFHVPPRLPQGAYTLRIVVRDETNPATKGLPPRVAESSLDFQVRANGAVRQQRPRASEKTHTP